MEKKDVERAKEIIKKFDPALVMMAMQETDTKVEDVEKVKEGIRKVYESIPDTKNRSEILSKAVTEVETEVIDKEVKNVRAAIEDIDKAVLMEAAEDLEIVDPARRICPYYNIGCYRYNIGCYRYLVGCHISIGCHRYLVGCHFSIGGCHYYIRPPEHECGAMLGPDYGCIGSLGFEVVPPEEYITHPLKEEIVKEVVTSPELFRAMEKMIKEMKKKGEL